jgi:hypothetical protein
MARGSVSKGKLIMFSMGASNLPKSSNAPLALNIDIAMRIATNVGSILKTVWIPVFAPLVKVENILTLLNNPCVIISRRSIGVIDMEIRLSMVKNLA